MSGFASSAAAVYQAAVFLHGSYVFSSSFILPGVSGGGGGDGGEQWFFFSLTSVCTA